MCIRDRCGEVWRSSPPIQNNAIYDYTQSYHKFNEPLRGLEYGSEQFFGVGNVDSVSYTHLVSARERLKAAELIGKRYGMFKDNLRCPGADAG